MSSMQPQGAASTRKLMKLGEHAMNKNRGQEAVDLFKQVLALNPHHAQALHNIAFILHSAGSYAEAEAIYHQALEADPHHVESYILLCKIYETQNRGDEALKLAQYATQRVPDDARTHGELMNMLLRFNQSHLVPTYAEEVLQRFPGNADIMEYYAISLKINNRFEDAEAVYRALVTTQRRPSSFRILFETYMPRLPISNAQIDQVRARFADSIEGFIKERPIFNLGMLSTHPLFQLAFHNRDNKNLMQRYTTMLRLLAPELHYTAPHCKQPRAPRSGALRIGFVSRHMHDHSVGSCYRNVLLTLAAQPDFAVTLFTLSQVMDDKTQQMIDAGVPIVSLPKHIAAAQKVIAEAAIDILIYPDLGMDAMTHYLAMARLATYQCCLQGHPDTTGLETMDYFISTRLYETAQGQENYTERLLHLPKIDTIFPRPAAPTLTYSRAELGLPEDKKLYVCPMAIQKFHPDFDAILAGILAQDANGVIVLFSDFQQRMASEGLQQRILSQCDAARVIFLPWQPMDRLMSILTRADAVLDTIYFGAGTTSQYAFALGVPIVTLPGTHARGRMVQAYYRLMEIAGAPVAGSMEEYIRTAVRLAHDRTYYDGLAEQLRAQNHRLFEDRANADSWVQLMHDIHAQTLETYAF